MSSQAAALRTSCACCGASVRSDSTYFSVLGEVCGGCHAEEEAADSRRFAAGADGDSLEFGVGPVALDSEGLTLDLTGAVRFIVSLLGRLFGR